MRSIASSAEAGPPVRRRTERLLATLLPVVVFLVYALATPGLTRGDSAGVYVTAAALVEGRGFAIDGYTDALATNPSDANAAPSDYPGVAYAAGHYYHAAPPGRALLAAPLYALGLALAPLLGPDTPAILVALLGPLLGAIVAGWAARRFWERAAPPVALALAALSALLLLPWAIAPSVPIVVAVLTAIAGSASGALVTRQHLWRAALMLGAALGSLALVDYLGGGLACLLAVVGIVVLLRRRARVAALGLVVGAAIPLLALAAWQTAAFGLPWRLAFRLATDPGGRSLGALVRPATIAALALAIVFAYWLAPVVVPRLRVSAVLSGTGMLFTSASFGLNMLMRATVLSVRWWEPAALVPLLIGALLLAVVLLAWGRLPRVGASGATAPITFVAVLIAAPLLAALPRGTAAASVASPENFLAPFAIKEPNGIYRVWTFDGLTDFSGPRDVASLRLDPDGVRLLPGVSATSPWIEARAGQAYDFAARVDGDLRVRFLWEDVARANVGAQEVVFPSGGTRRARFAAPVGAAGLRVQLLPGDALVVVEEPRLTLAGGARVETFPDGKRAALAFSFDWESAMGGLIHSRSAGNGEGEGTTVGQRADGGPSVTDAEEKGRRMRDGAEFLADLFARNDIRATFYATGYNLLDGNPACQKFLGDPVYRNANAANGWANDWWRTHPWYGDDPCSIEAQAPAWYFASVTRALAGAGHEIASHSFGHLYVRGVTPEQLAADLEQWNRSATALGLPPARTFAFPWTSSNSLDAPFWAVFARVGMTTLTRLYPLDLRHPYELDRLKGAPNLLVFPDFYLASKPEAEQEALARIDTTLAVRGYHSLWDHPNEALEQGGQVIWSRVVAYAAGKRDAGLWIAPVGEIAAYGEATRGVAVTTLPVAGGTRLTVENRSGRALDGVTLRLTTAGAVTIDGRDAPPGAQVVLPHLEPGARAVVVARR